MNPLDMLEAVGADLTSYVAQQAGAALYEINTGRHALLCGARAETVLWLTRAALIAEGLDENSVRLAEPHEIHDAIRCRGTTNYLEDVIFTSVSSRPSGICMEWTLLGTASGSRQNFSLKILDSLANSWGHILRNPRRGYIIISRPTQTAYISHVDKEVKYAALSTEEVHR